MLHKGLTSVTIGLCSNCWMTLIMANKCNWWQVYITDGIPNIQCLYSIDVHATHTHGILRIEQTSLPSFVSKTNDNAYSTPLHHEVWNVEHQMVFPGINLCYNTFSHRIFFCICPDQWHHFCGALFSSVVGIHYLNLNHCFGWQYVFASRNQICLFQVVEHWTLFNMYNAYKQIWVHLQHLFHAQVHISLNQYRLSNIET